jgi:phosphoribosylanthranilate isomerase
VGFVFYPPSARCLRPDDAAALAARLPPEVASVGVVVDPSDAELDAILASVPLDVLQLHGAEPPERVAAIALRTGCRVMKALRVETAGDLADAPAFAAVVDLLMFDAKPPRRADALPGGNGLPFDWRALDGRAWPVPWALAGGLTPESVGAAIARLDPPIVDVSSGVETHPGIKDPARLDAFFAAVGHARQQRTPA